MSLANAKFQIKTVGEEKKINSRAEIPQKLFKITQVSFYKTQKEDREIFIIGLVLIFIQKLTFFFF